MFARAHRFSFKRGAPRNFYNTSLFILRYDRNVNSNLECAVVVGKKVDKKAVVRNRIKRQLVAQIKSLVPTTTPYRVVIIAKKPILEATNDKKYEELTKAFQSTKIT